MSAGYSNTPLVKKLGINDVQKILLINEPTDYYNLIGKDLVSQFCKKGESPDFIHLFILNRKELEKEMALILKKIKPTTVIWVSWYKKSSGLNTDVTDNVIRNWALGNGLVDVKVCAVSDTWSGLKLVVPLKMRK
ncbi:MAG: hypothetical protein ABI691_07530 [Ginsengibacter sp.]